MEGFLKNIPQHLHVYVSLSVTELITRLKEGRGLYHARLSRSDTIHLKNILTFLISENPTRFILSGIELEMTQTEIKKIREAQEIEIWVKEREQLWEQQRLQIQRQEDERREQERQRLENVRNEERLENKRQEDARREQQLEEQRQRLTEQRRRLEDQRQRLEEEHRESMSRHTDKTNNSTRSMDTDLSTIDQLQEEEPIW